MNSDDHEWMSRFNDFLDKHEPPSEAALRGAIAELQDRQEPLVPEDDNTPYSGFMARLQDTVHLMDEFKKEPF